MSSSIYVPGAERSDVLSQSYAIGYLNNVMMKAKVSTEYHVGASSLCRDMIDMAYFFGPIEIKIRVSIDVWLYVSVKDEGGNDLLRRFTIQTEYQLSQEESRSFGSDKRSFFSVPVSFVVSRDDGYYHVLQEVRNHLFDERLFVFSYENAPIFGTSDVKNEDESKTGTESETENKSEGLTSCGSCGIIDCGDGGDDFDRCDGGV